MEEKKHKNSHKYREEKRMFKPRPGDGGVNQRWRNPQRERIDEGSKKLTTGHFDLCFPVGEGKNGKFLLLI